MLAVSDVMEGTNTSVKEDTRADVPARTRTREKPD